MQVVIQLNCVENISTGVQVANILSQQCVMCQQFYAYKEPYSLKQLWMCLPLAMMLLPLHEQYMNSNDNNRRKYPRHLVNLYAWSQMVRLAIVAYPLGQLWGSMLAEEKQAYL